MHLSGASAGGGEAVAPGLEGHAPVDDPDNLQRQPHAETIDQAIDNMDESIFDVEIEHK